MLERYKELLAYVNDAVTRNYSEKVLNSILDDIGTNEDMGFLQEFYETTLKKLEEAKNERLWFKANLKLCALLFDAKEFPQMQLILRELHKSCQNEDGTLDQRKGTQLLEVYSIEIQMYTAQKNTKKLKDLYVKALQVTSAIPHPRISGVIRECGGKMYMTERQWELAATDFFEAFKSYDEAGSERRVQCLKYLVLANMLMESAVDPLTRRRSNHTETIPTSPPCAPSSAPINATTSPPLNVFSPRTAPKSWATTSSATPSRTCSKTFARRCSSTSSNPTPPSPSHTSPPSSTFQRTTSRRSSSL